MNAVNDVVNLMKAVKVKLAIKMALKNLKCNSSIKGLKIKDGDISFALGELTISGESSDVLLDLLLSGIGSHKDLNEFKLPVEYKGGGEMNIAIKKFSFTDGDDSFEIEELELNSVSEGIEFVMDVLGSGLAKLDSEKQEGETGGN